MHEGWGGTNVNQETTWGGDAEKPLPPPPLGRPSNANIGTDNWENNVRQGGGKIVKSDSMAGGSSGGSAWSHKPASNHGGYWDESNRDDHHNVPPPSGSGWGAPQSNGISNNTWGEFTFLLPVCVEISANVIDKMNCR